jgi:hypothetical protein
MENPLELPVRLMSKVYKVNLNALKSPANDDGFERGTRSILAFEQTALTTFQQPLHFALPDSVVPIIDTLRDSVDTCMLELNMDLPYTIEYFGITDDPQILTSKFFPLCVGDFAV